MSKLSVLVLFFGILFSCQSQNKKHVGGKCEGCEAVYDYGNKKLKNIDTLPNFAITNPKLKISGIVYQNDGKTPAKNVIVYIYHTNRKGVYEKRGDEKGWDKRHGFIRGWIKTNADGKYIFYTFRPASYPNSRAPQHIHMMIKESNINEYYIDDIMFADDEFLDTSFRERLGKRGGSGVVTPKLVDGMLVVKRDIILGKNIPNY